MGTMANGNGNGAAPGGETVHVRFAVKADTVYGQSLLVSGSIPELGEFTPDKALAMRYEHPGTWVAELSVTKSEQPLSYIYVRAEEGVTRLVREAGSERQLETAFGSLTGDVFVKDTFRVKPDTIREIFRTGAFTDVIFRRDQEDRQPIQLAKAEESAAISKAMVYGKGAFVARFVVFAGRVKPDDEVCIVGSIEELGSNENAKAIPMSDTHAPFWTAAVPIPSGKDFFTYKCLIRKKGSSSAVGVTEVGPPREFTLAESDKSGLMSSNASVVVFYIESDTSFRYPQDWRGAGVAVPVFALRTADSCGVGEFLDLKKMVDFCVATGHQLLQLLPVNDTTVYNTWRDSYPYKAVSSFALHPQYINLDAIKGMPSSVRSELNSERERLNKLPEIDYEEVMRVKLGILRKMYSMNKVEFLKSRDFIEYFKNNQNWLVPYALFRMLMDINGTSEFEQWGARAEMSIEQMEELAAPDTFHFDYIGLTYFTQFYLHKQLKEASDYASANQVVFKGDLPIGVGRHSTDTWVDPSQYRLQVQAGAPPDYFSVEGQNWGFPTYDWETMRKDNFGWWRSRLGQMANYFHAYRIDHILGFFRIWEIPSTSNTGMAGRYKPVRAITKSELDMRGLWDMDRFLSPYVHDGVLQSTFGADWTRVKNRFFEPTWGDRLKFKDDYNTEKKAAHELEQTGEDGILRKLYTLHNNVLLLADVEEPNVYHPRFNMSMNSSFKELPDEWKAQFSSLYEDYFFRRQDDLWKSMGEERLPVMKEATKMLVCGEDLGFVPACVPSVMEAASIVGLRVQRMPADDEEFGSPSKYPYATVSTTSSHDTSTFRGWWEDSAELSPESKAKYWREILRKEGSPPAQCTTDVVEMAVRDHLAGPSIWVIFPIQDLLGFDNGLRRQKAADEKINDPSNNTHYWRFRLHLKLEEILANPSFLEKCAKLNSEYQRGVPY